MHAASEQRSIQYSTMSNPVAIQMCPERPQAEHGHGGSRLPLFPLSTWYVMIYYF